MRGKNQLRVIVSREIGFCSGVRRAIKLALKAVDTEERVYSLGPIIHNPQVVEELERRGVKPLKRIGKGGAALIIRSHGASPKTIASARAKGYKIIDATCPFVKKAQSNALKLHNSGYQVVIVGERSHPEVTGILSGLRDAIVIENPDKAKVLNFEDKVGIVAQTTVLRDMLGAVVSEVVTKSKEVVVFNTICLETAKRHEEAKRIAQQCDAVLVVGGRNSANTTRLHAVCKSICARCYHIETVDEISAKWFRRQDRVGVVAGASTPRWLVKEVVGYLRHL